MLEAFPVPELWLKALVPENRLVFPALSVHENLLAGAFRRRDRAGIRADLDTGSWLERLPSLAPAARYWFGVNAGAQSAA